MFLLQVQPFSFADRDQIMLKKKQEKIEKVWEQEKQEREFKANPMPKLDQTVGIPVKDVPPATKPNPFKLEVNTNSSLMFTIFFCTYASLFLHFALLIHQADPQSRPVVIVFAHVRSFQNKTNFKRKQCLQLAIGLWVWLSGSLMTPVL